MDMKLDFEKVIAERNRRAWSQQQLADVAEVSLRTVQRIENTGRTSQESLMAVAAAFSLDVSDFLQDEPASTTSIPIEVVAKSLAFKRSPYVYSVMALMALSSSLYYFYYFLNQQTSNGVMLSYVFEKIVSEEDSYRAEGEFLMSFERDVKMKLPHRNDSEFILKAVDRGEKVSLEVSLFDSLENDSTVTNTHTIGEIQSIGSNALSVEFGKTASFTWQSDNGPDYLLKIIPTRESI